MLLTDVITGAKGTRELRRVVNAILNVDTSGKQRHLDLAGFRPSTRNKRKANYR